MDPVLFAYMSALHSSLARCTDSTHVQYMSNQHCVPAPPDNLCRRTTVVGLCAAAAVKLHITSSRTSQSITFRLTADARQQCSSPTEIMTINA